MSTKRPAGSDPATRTGQDPNWDAFHTVGAHDARATWTVRGIRAGAALAAVALVYTGLTGLWGDTLLFNLPASIFGIPLRGPPLHVAVVIVTVLEFAIPFGLAGYGFDIMADRGRAAKRRREGRGR